MNRIIINNQIHACLSMPDKIDSIVLFCHGFGETKETINRYCNTLNENNIGIIGFDFPSHGEDDIDFRHFNYDNCIKYINDVKTYLDTIYPNIPISFMGCSFGGYMILNYLNENEGNYRVILNYPGVNFCDVVMRKLNFDLSYFDNHNFLYNEKTGYTLFKDSFFSFYNHDVRINYHKHNNDFYVIHGREDHTVYLSDVEDFCHEYDIKLKVIDNDRHGLLNSLDIVNSEIIKFLKN